MIFVTVGTHEQSFTRLVEHMNGWAKNHKEKVIIQTGFTDYDANNCECRKFYEKDEIEKLMDDARIIITHGGPSSFIEALQKNKIPIVVPRRHELDEHVNNHQINFCNEFAKRYNNIIVIDDINQLDSIIKNYDNICRNKNNQILNHNKEFCEAFINISNELIGQYV